MASGLTGLLKDLLHRAALRSSNSTHCRLVLGGPPRAILEELFTVLTRGDGSPWQHTDTRAIPVFLVTHNPESEGAGLSRQCNWDYSLAIRNSFPSFVLLVDPTVWDDRTYSIINATETIGRPLPPIRRQVPALRDWSPFYASLVEMAAAEREIDANLVEAAIQQALQDLPSLEPADQHRHPWQILDDLCRMFNSDCTPTNNDLARICGLLPFEGDNCDFSRSRATLRRLAEYLEDAGIEDGLEELAMTTIGSGLTQHLAAIGGHYRTTAGSASAVARAPCFYHSTVAPDPSCQVGLTVEAVDQMLAEVGRPEDSERISVLCRNPLNPSPKSGEPFLVQDRAIIEANHPEDRFQALRILRRLGRQQATALGPVAACQSPARFEDSAIPVHSAPVTYIAEDHGATPGSLQIVSLASFDPRAFITCPGSNTSKVSRPRRVRGSALWRQEILLQSGGVRMLRVFCARAVSKVRIVEPAEQAQDQSVIDGMADLQLRHLDDDAEMTLELTDQDGHLLSTFAVAIFIGQGPDTFAPSRFHALVECHQDMKKALSPARSKESWLRSAESELLSNGSSWRPIVATLGWADSQPRLADSSQLGIVQLQVDPRPDITPPATFLESRRSIVNRLNLSSLLLPEEDLANDDVVQLASDHLRAYREWVASAPAEACWSDTIALLEAEPGTYGGQAVAAFEPIAVLASPLHPIRFGWHTAAQRLLTSALGTPCPLAGLLDPHRAPEVLSLALIRGGAEPRWKSYIAISCEDAMWGLYWDAARLREMQQHTAVAELVAAGIVPRGVQSGFTASQARTTLEEIRRVLPTRANLRIGIVGSEQGSTTCTEGLISWSRGLFDTDTEGLSGPRSLDVYDSRKTHSQPSSEEISSLADDTGHRVRWYSPSSMIPAKDLVIVDHLGMASPVGDLDSWRSPTTEGGLIRSRIRLDRNDAELVVESRSSDVVRSEDRLLDELSLTIGQVEDPAERRGTCSHIAFTPNRQVIRNELKSTRFLAVSSTEIDPACFARSTPLTGGFLWDYELPHGIGPGEQRGGFYLLARPPEAMRRAVVRATRIISQSKIDLDSLLEETSRRGIPILKRLAAGGSLARGELGMLLAVRLLQDSFRGPTHTARLPVEDDGSICMVLPVDPYAALLEKIRDGLRKANAPVPADTRPDLLVACIRIDIPRGTHVRLVPLEVKFREGTMSRSAKQASLAQANSLGEMLHHMFRATPLNELWRLCSLGILSEILDHGFRVYGDQAVHGQSPDRWVTVHNTCLTDVSSGKATISVADEGRLVVFDESADSHLDDLDGDGFAETLVVSRQDSAAILSDEPHLSPRLDQIVSLLDILDVDAGIGSPPADSAVDTDGQADISSTSDPGGPEAAIDTGSGRESQSQSDTVPLGVREHVARAFSGFIGNRPAIDTLRRGILKALLSDPPQLPASYLFTGNPSTGKTELARRVARALALPFVSLDGRGLVSRERLFNLVDSRLRDDGQEPLRIGTQYQLPKLEYPPLVVFVDEVHLAPRSVQESLLTALEPKDRTVLLADRVASLPRVTFLFATTRPSEVDMPFRTRCTEVPLQDYDEDEVSAIVGLEHPDWPELLRRRIARYGRLVPRTALDVARELADESLVSEHQDRDLGSHLDEVGRTRRVDENGLGQIDIDYLELLEREGKPLGERNILTMLESIDKDRFIEEVEPLLVARMKLVRRTGRGREITPDGRRYLREMRKKEADST